MKNGLLYGIIGLVVGLIGGYFIGKGQRPETENLRPGTTEATGNKSAEDANAYFDFTPLTDSTRGGQPITKKEAEDMIKAYRDEAEKLWYPLRTADGKSNLHGFFVNKNVFETLLITNHCNGIRLYLAKHPNTDKRTGYTLVIVGTKQSTGAFKDLNGNDDDPTSYFEEIDPCPTNCGSTGTTTGGR